MSKFSNILRSALLAGIVVAAAFLCGLRLLEIQIADGGKYLAMTKQTYTAQQDIEAARGKIADRAGRILNTNELDCSVNLQKASLAAGTENEVVYRILTVLLENGEEWNESLPITKTQPYRFVDGKETSIDSLKSRLKLGVYATVENCMNALYEQYEISDSYSEPMRRYIAGVRYEMSLKDFNYRNKYVIASGLSGDTVLELKELSSLMAGMEISENWNRLYLDGTTAPHLRGTVGAISAEKYAELQSSGYTMNDIIGTSGIELAFEDTLRGQRGTREITRNSDGVKISDEVIKQPKAGNSVMLTIDSDFQNMVEDIVQYHMDFLHSPYYTSAMDAKQRGRSCEIGSAVVLDVKDGSVLAMVTLPSYDINDLVENYSAVLNAKNSPLFNRALNGEYRPGSTFKTITATAGLAEGTITPSTRISCGGVYTYYADSGFKPGCTGVHGAITVQHGLMYSCNIFFYETARLMGIDRLAYWATRYGVGQDLGFELPMSTGRMTSPELFDRLGIEWNASDTIQAGIGQSETLLTTLHLATQAMTIANDGVRYRPHIVKAVYNYDFTKMIEETKPKVMDDLDGMDDIFAEVKAGMKLVSDRTYFLIDGGWYNIYDYKGIGKENVCTKTGTPQVVGMQRFNSTIVGFYPADDPEIAFGICLEDGEFSRHVACNIISAYATGKFEPLYDEEGYATHPLGEKKKDDR